MSSGESHSYLAFDLGASSSRAVLGTLKEGILEMEELHRFTTPVLETGGHLYWDLEAIWSELLVGLQMALATGSHLRSLSVDSWAVDYVRLDEAGEAIGNPFCYRDPRTSGVMKRAFDTVPAKTIFNITGIQFLPFNTLFQVLADRHAAPAEPREAGNATNPQTATHLPIADYFNWKFSGRGAIEVSMASTTQLMDVRTRQWSVELLGGFGFDDANWPEIVPAGTWLAPALCEPSVAVVATCSHDTGCAVAAAPAVEDDLDWAFISCGTWSLMGVERQEPLLSDAAREAGFTNEAGLDGTVRFLKNLTGLWVLQECMREWRKAGPLTWSALEKEARAVTGPGAFGDQIDRLKSAATFIDLEDPRFLARGDMEQRLHEYGHEHGMERLQTRGEIALAILSSIADSYRRTLVELESITGRKSKRIHLFGGGSKNEMLCRLTAAACRVEVVAGPSEATAMGNLLIQARSMGDMPAGRSIRDIAFASSQLKVYSPDHD